MADPPISLFDELKHRKVFKVGAAYLVVAWLAVQAASIGFPAFDAPPWALRIFILVVFLGLPVSLVFAWAFEVTPDGLKSEGVRGSKRLLLVAAALAALAFVWYFKGQPAYLDRPAPAVPGNATATTGIGAPDAAPRAVTPISKKSVAVLPFVNMSADKDQDYFSDGISEEILNALAQVQDLKVAGRTSSFQFKGKNQDLRAVGQALGVAHVLEGSVRKQGEKVRITAQLVQTADGFHVWSESYDGDLKDVFQLQENIARAITDKLQVILSGDQAERLVAVPTQNTEAYSLYLQASQTFNRRDGARFGEAIAQLEQALRLDPRFARAHSRIAALQSLAGNYDPRVQDSSAVAAEAHAQQAIKLDAKLAEPYAVLGNLYGRQRRFVEAFETFNRALAIDPNDVTSNFWNAALLCQTGYLSRCDAALDRVLEIDPMLPNALSWRGREYVRAGNLDAGEKMLLRSKDAGLAHAGMALSDLAKARGNLADAEKFLVQGNAPLMGDLPPGSNEIVVHGIFGDATARAAALADIERYLATKPRPLAGVAAESLLRMDPRRGLLATQDAPTNNDSMLLTPLWDLNQTNARMLPEFAEFARRAGLARLWDTLGPPDQCSKNDKGDYVCH